MAQEIMERVSTRLPRELIDQLEQLASSERRPVSMMTRMLLEEALAARSKKVGKKQ